jgi:GNAT superfamily N-acetyltransferase
LSFSSSLTAHMLIRPFEPADISAAADVLRRAAETFILHECMPEDAASFLAEHDAAALRRNLDAGFVYHAAVVDGVLAGFIGVRGGTHLYHLFVDAAYQRRGIARALWEVALAQALQPGHPGIFTVNASNVAVPLYASLGFERTAPMVPDKVPYNPMRLVVAGSVPLVGAA